MEDGQRRQEKERRPRGRSRRRQQETDIRPPREVSIHMTKEGGGPSGYVRPGSPKREDRPRTMTERGRRTEGQEPGIRKEETVGGSGGQASMQEDQPTTQTVVAEEGRTEI